MSHPNLVVDGIDYISARQIEKEYNLSRATCWRALQKFPGQPLHAHDRYFYVADLVRMYFSSLSQK